MVQRSVVLAVLAFAAVGCRHAQLVHSPEAVACDPEHAWRCTGLGLVEADSAHAGALFEKACRWGDAGGCALIGASTADPERAFTLLKLGCDGGNALACERLGEMYEHGTLVTKDIARATALYQKACAAGDVLACGEQRPARTCVVLSVGGPKGIAHLGALDALQKAGVKIDCVYGNSMGSLVGSLYASSPKEDVTTRYRGLIAAYERATEQKKVRHGLLGALLGVGAVVASGGTVAVAALAGLGSGAVGLTGTKTMDDQRVEEVLDTYLSHARIEAIPVPFAVSYGVVNGGGLKLEVATRGLLAAAVAHSINNPYIFKEGTDLTYVDPGGDRAAEVPIEDACRVFRPTKIIAINVSGDPAYYRPVDCEVKEIVVPIGAMSADEAKAAFLGKGEAFERLYRAGYDATQKALTK